MSFVSNRTVLFTTLMNILTSYDPHVEVEVKVGLDMCRMKDLNRKQCFAFEDIMWRNYIFGLLPFCHQDITQLKLKTYRYCPNISRLILWLLQVFFYVSVVQAHRFFLTHLELQMHVLTVWLFSYQRCSFTVDMRQVNMFGWLMHVKASDFNMNLWNKYSSLDWNSTTFHENSFLSFCLL